MDPASQPSPPPPALDHCPVCSQATLEPSRCPRCGTSLLVDVLLEPPPSDPRRAFQAARVAAAAGIPGLDFRVARAALSRPGAPLASAVPRDRARTLLAALAAERFAASARPAAASPGGPGLRPGVVAAVLVGLAVLGGGAAIAVRAARQPTPAAAPVAPVLAPADLVSAPPVPGAPAGAPVAAALARGLSTSELSRIAGAALATLTCPGRLGSGFFVTPDRVLTNAHVTCGDKVPIDVKLGDGRTFVGRVVARDEWLDYAVVEVPGAGIPAPLALGDSTALEVGEPVVLVGNPLGLTATLHDGKVSFVGRNLQGVAHLQVNASVNPGNSGGPLLDGLGRAVGIVTLKAIGADGIGFALPVEYARDALGAPDPLDSAASAGPAGGGWPGASRGSGGAQAPLAKRSGAEHSPGWEARWSAITARVKGEDDDDARRFAERLERGVLVGVAPGMLVQGDALTVVVMQRSTYRPSSTPIEIEVRDGGELLCVGSGRATHFTDVEERARQQSEEGRAERTVRWMLRRGLAADVYEAVALVDIAKCPTSASAAAVVSLRGAPADVVPYPAPGIAQSRARWASRAAYQAADQDARAQASWRAAFRQAKERVARLSERRKVLRRALEDQVEVRLMNEARRDLPTLEQELARAQEALDDLERRASREAVPRQWRE